MKNVLLQRAIKLTKQNKRRRNWQKLVRVIAAVVVFCTTYALILPAITMEKETICGLREHTHTDKCYTEKTRYLMHCTLETEPGDLVLHTHQEHCYTPDGKLICQIVERPAHTHDESCYQAPACVCRQAETAGHTHSEACTTGRVLTCTTPVSEGHRHDDSCTTQRVLVCGMEETPGHSHSEACVSTETVLTCTEEHEHADTCYTTVEVPCPLPESEGHTHSESCYETRTVPCEQEETEGHTHSEACYGIGPVECTIPETPGHTHTEDCYEKQGALSCGLEERQPHTHDERCYDSKGNLTCTLPRTIVHVHDDTCVTDTGEKVSVLTCNQKVHTHNESCYAKEEAPALEFKCGAGEHRHAEACYDAEGGLTCTIPEHTHDASCVVADLDLSADVETPEQWEETLRDVELTGQWPQDVLAVANTQLKYRESAKNCILSEMQLKGYTRYGARYGTPYADWDTLFVSFCLDYAGVEDFPVHADRTRWITLLEEEELYRDPAAYTPKPGDLVFFDLDQVADAPVEIPVEADLMGIVEEFLPETDEEPLRLQVIAGNVENKVDHVICEMPDITIIGYAELPLGTVQEQPVETRQLVYNGEDYTVTVTFGPEAQLPENTVLDVREILPDTEEYAQYYQQSVATIQGDSQQPEAAAEETPADEETPAETEAETEEVTDQESEEEQMPKISFARFFDIHFVADDVVLEPAAPVDISIQYHQGIAQEDPHKGMAVHFAESGIELLDAETSWNQDSQVESFSFTQNSFSVSGTVLVAEPRAVGGYYVWLDGTCGGLAVYTGSENKSISATNPYTLPDNFTSPTTYRFRLNGWYDVTHGEYYQPGAEVQITSNTVFYADWVAETYDIGQYIEGAVKTADTSEFVTIDVFDYNILFNTHSSRLSNSSIGNNSHSETWAHVTSGNDTYNFVFVDSNSESSGKIANTTGRNSGSLNVYTGGTSVFTGIMPQNLKAQNADLDLMNALFDKNQTNVLGRHYLGTGNHLFQYDSDPTSEHFGYYYYDSELNAASYNQTDKRFYVYDYLEHASSSAAKDFLPLNSPYANNSGNKKPSGNADSGYTYHTTQHNNQTTSNFFFGMKTNIHFYLPNDVGFVDPINQNPGNLDTNGKPMVFDFSGDDDVWIYVDDVLVLDIGGIHQGNGGSVNFSTGEIVKPDGKTSNLNDLYPDGLKEGGHNLTIYYLERGCGESNCSIYFNLAPRYGLNLRKQDYHTRENLNNVEFGVFVDEACTIPANLWPTHAAAKLDPNHDNVQHIYKTQNGYLSFFGLVAGKTYYIKELAPPSGYRATNDLIRVTLNNHGVDISEVTMLGGADGRTQGYELISHNLDEVNQVVNLVLTNQKIPNENEKTKHVRATKEWVLSDKDPADIPESVTVHLTKDGQHYGHSMTLSPENGWTYTWTGLPDDGSEYAVTEDQVPGFELVQPAATFAMRNTPETSYEINWLEVGALEDSADYLLSIGGKYVVLEEGKLLLETVPSVDGKLNPPDNALWSVSAAGEGFCLSNGSYAITLESGNFTVRTSGTGNQTLFYDGEGLFAMQSGILHYLRANNNSVASGSSVSSVKLIKREEIPIDIHHIRLTNAQLDAEQTTFLKVKKVWNTDSAIWDREVTIHLLKNGKDSGISMLLDRNCNWEGTFEGLPVKDENGTPYNYSVEEASVAGFSAEYSELTKIPGGEKTVWKSIDSLAQNQTYVFVGSNNMALATSINNPTTTKLENQDNPAERQQWLYTSSGKLKNVGNNRYLRLTKSGNRISLSTDSNEKNGSVVYLENDRLYIKDGNTNYYLTVANNLSAGNQGGTTLEIYQKSVVTTSEGYQVTVTNSPVISYLLPSTGGPGIGLYTILGLTMAVTAVTVLLIPSRKGGRYIR